MSVRVKRPLHPALTLLLLGGLALLPARPAAAYDYPTSQRVIYVEDCIRQNPGPYFEMINKCACALDHISQAISYEDFVTMLTATNATSMAGERGNAIRDDSGLQKDIRRFRDIEIAARKTCFIGAPQVH